MMKLGSSKVNVAFITIIYYYYAMLLATKQTKYKVRLKPIM